MKLAVIIYIIDDTEADYDNWYDIFDNLKDNKMNNESVITLHIFDYFKVDKEYFAIIEYYKVDKEYFAIIEYYKVDYD